MHIRVQRRHRWRTVMQKIIPENIMIYEICSSLAVVSCFGEYGDGGRRITHPMQPWNVCRIAIADLHWSLNWRVVLCVLWYAIEASNDYIFCIVLLPFVSMLFWFCLHLIFCCRSRCRGHTHTVKGAEVCRTTSSRWPHRRLFLPPDFIGCLFFIVLSANPAYEKRHHVRFIIFSCFIQKFTCSILISSATNKMCEPVEWKATTAGFGLDHLVVIMYSVDSKQAITTSNKSIRRIIQK